MALLAFRLLIEFVYCALWSFFFLTTSIDTASRAHHNSALGAASFFGFAATVAYAADAFLKFRGFRAGQLAQGERMVQKTTSSVAAGGEVPAPAY